MKEFFKKHLGSDSVIWIVFALLCVISVIEMYSAATKLVTSAVAEGTSYNTPIFKQLIILFGGIVGIILLHYIPFKIIRFGGYVMLLASVVLLLITLASGSSTNGASRWLFGFQPSELAKLSVIIVVADLISRIRDNAAEQKRYFWGIMLVTVAVCGLIFPENFSTAALLFGVVFLMMFVGQISWKYLAGTLGAIAVFLVIVFAVVKVLPDEKMQDGILHRADTWINRVENHGDNATQINDDNRQVVHAKIAIAQGNSNLIVGAGPGNSEQRYYLSNASSDFVFAIIVEEMGLLGGIFVIALYLVLLYRAGRVATKSKTVFPSVIVIGLTLMIVIQAFTHMAVATNLGPVTGQPLPLISHGGTSVIMTCIYIGIILSATRQIRNE
ncbi:MAG: FtsW/RodA/SpoVE family cell cycle protein [Paludibacter sp.]|jgi:cell division protein FtsW|nr:FtsW/RodA/SpoVE family cell cycle protein [Paludibacter sp.]